MNEELKHNYYEYVSKISEGCLVITENLRKGHLEQAFLSIINFSEGIEWLMAAEQILKEQNLVINSRISEANDFLNEINQALEVQDFILVADLFEYEISPLFSSASEWIFMAVKE